MTSSDSPTRLAFCITDLDPGGAEKALVQIVQRLDRAEWEPMVWCLSQQGALVEELAKADVPVTCLGARGKRDLRVVWTLSRQLRRRRPALLQTFLYHANVAGRIAGKLAGVPHVVSGIRVAEKRSRLPLWMDRLTQPLVDRHVCVSQAVAEFSIAAGLDRKRVIVIPNGVDAERFMRAEPADLSEFGIPAGSQTVIWVGRLDPQKQPLMLVEAAELVLQSAGAGTHFLIVGDGPLWGEVGSVIARKGLTKNVHLAGWRGDVAELMRSADCLVLTSAWEGMPNVILEAMAAGLPVVSADVEGVREVVNEGVTGLIASSDTPQAMAERIGQILRDAELRRKLGVTSQQNVTKEFTWNRITEAYADLYRELLQK